MWEILTTTRGVWLVFNASYSLHEERGAVHVDACSALLITQMAVMHGATRANGMVRLFEVEILTREIV